MNIKTTIKEAFIASLPVLMGYLSMGIAWGVLFSGIDGSNIWLAGAVSASTISGSMQFAAIEMLQNQTAYTLLLTAFMALMINIRYAAYGLPFIELFKTYPWYLRWYLILCLTDETYALQLQCRHTGRAQKYYLFFVAFFDQCYWVAGGMIGVGAGKLISFDTRGIDFAMVALFIVILVDQLRERSNRIPALLGGVITLAVLVAFAVVSPQNINKMPFAALSLIIVVLILLKKRLQREEAI